MTRKRLRRQVVEFVDVQGFDDPQGLRLNSYPALALPVGADTVISDVIRHWFEVSGYLLGGDNFCNLSRVEITV